MVVKVIKSGTIFTSITTYLSNTKKKLHYENLPYDAVDFSHGKRILHTGICPMSIKKISAIFTIVEEKNCPLYQQGERLLLSERTFSCPEGKEVCLILVRDMTQLLFTFLQKQPFDPMDYVVETYNCSGCRGLIKFALVQEDCMEKSDTDEGVVAQIETTFEKLYGKKIISPFLEMLPPGRGAKVLDHFSEISLINNTVLINQGAQNLNLYIVLEGELVVENNGLLLATLGEGELCGEMSYLGADVAVSTVRAVEGAKVLAIGGDVFGTLVGDEPQVQTFMAQLLASRLTKTNAARSKDFESCMSGRVDQILPAELFQIFHMHQKTGVLTLELARGNGHVSFREGCIINAGYDGLLSQDAIFEILGEKTGVYRFTTGLSPSEMKAAEIGDFMMLLMEGVKRIDEEFEG